MTHSTKLTINNVERLVKTVDETLHEEIQEVTTLLNEEKCSISQALATHREEIVKIRAEFERIYKEGRRRCVAALKRLKSE